MAAPAPPTGERILPGTHVLIRLPSGAPRVIRILPDTTISLGKFGAFPANALIHRPYNLTFDILDAPATGLRVVSAAEVTRDILGGDAEAELEAGGHYELEYEDAEGGDQVMRTNRETVDDPLAQKMSWVEIEELKKQGTGSGRVLYYYYVSTVPKKKLTGYDIYLGPGAETALISLGTPPKDPLRTTEIHPPQNKKVSPSLHRSPADRPGPYKLPSGMQGAGKDAGSPRRDPRAHALPC